MSNSLTVVIHDTHNVLYRRTLISGLDKSTILNVCAYVVSITQGVSQSFCTFPSIFQQTSNNSNKKHTYSYSIVSRGYLFVVYLEIRPVQYLYNGLDIF